MVQQETKWNFLECYYQMCQEAEEALEECQRSGDLEKRKTVLRETETVLGPTHPLRFQVRHREKHGVMRRVFHMSIAQIST